MPFFKIQARRIRFWWHLTWAYSGRYKLWLLSILTLVVISSYSFSKIWPKVTRTNLVTIGYVGNFNLENLPTAVLSLATQSLIAVDENGRPVPSLAYNWSVSEDGKTYVIFLKDNLKWHDLSDIDAKDISIAISGVEITALNNKTIQFKLQNPIASFPLALDKPVFKSKTFYGTGLYRITDIDQINGIVKKISLLPKDKYLPKVEIKFYPTEEQAATALKIGEIKSASIGKVQQLADWPNLEVEKETDYSKLLTLFYNNQDPLLSSRELRQALNHAINRTNFDGETALGPISPKNWAYSSNLKRFDYNQGKSKELLTKSNALKPKITLSFTKGLEEIAQAIKRDWQSVDIDVELKEEKTIPVNFQALLAVNKLMPDPDQYALWHSTQSTTNITNYKNVKIDKLLEDARGVQDEQARSQFYTDFQKFLVEDDPAAFLYFPYKYRVTYKNIKPLIEKLPK